MDERFRRAGAILGDAAMKKLSESRVAVLGLGGVGSWCAEALCRSGVGGGAAARYRPGKQDRPDGLPVRARDARYAA